LWKNDVPVPLAGKSLEAFLFLVQHRDRVVTKGELKNGVWQCHVSDNSVDQAISKIRAALGDARQELVQTVSTGRVTVLWALFRNLNPGFHRLLPTLLPRLAARVLSTVGHRPSLRSVSSSPWSV
jgi:hypothetical protein